MKKVVLLERQAYVYYQDSVSEEFDIRTPSITGWARTPLNVSSKVRIEQDGVSGEHDIRVFYFKRTSDFTEC